MILRRASKHHIPCVASLPDFRVTRVRIVADFRIGECRDNNLLIPEDIKMHAVLRSKVTLRRSKILIKALMNILRIYLIIVNTRVKEMHHAVLFYCASGKAAVLVLGKTREQGNADMLPVNQIRTHRMAPVHGAPARRVRKMLIKKMILSLIINHAVRVIHPVARRFYV